ncbi:PEPxxWA-CTERM sorting domain-containing protein [Phenylobacterium sp.]|uniref:PEPxxWA-CTERM sorting domain-containing protein n=1 Tax=Phenylobacterium sp. TaxID=1871053 RepID=UPI00374D5A66
MRLPLILAAASAFAVLAAQATPANAGPVPTHFTDFATFHQHNTFIETFQFSHLQVYPDPYEVGDLTLTTGGHNIAYAAGAAPFAPIADVFASSTHSAIEGLITNGLHFGPFDSVGFDLGNLVGPDPVDVTLTFASGGVYNTVVSSSALQLGTQFQGFLAPAGDFFTGFSLSSHGIDSRIAVERFVLGNTDCGNACGSNTPEPASWALLIAGFGAVGAALRTRRAGGVQRA